MKLKLIGKKQEASDCISFIFQSESPIEWKAGQFLQYTIPETEPDERGEKRFFTIATAPFEKHIMVTTRFIPGNGSTFKKHLQKMEVGAEIEAIGGPSGSFTIEDSAAVDGPEKPYVFMAGGIGITPFRSIILELAHNNQPINVMLLYANRNGEIVFKGELEPLREKHPQFKIEYAIDPQRVDVEFIKLKVSDLPGKFFYLSGPKPFVEGMKSNLEQLQIPKGQIKTDYFPGYN